MANDKNKKPEIKDDATLTSRLQETPIAIVGMAALFADAPNLEKYWDNIVERVDSIIDVPPSRWAIDDYYSPNRTDPDKSYCKRGGFIPDIDFDPMEFGLPPNILEVTDVAQLLTLVVAREVLDDAGIGEGSGYNRDRVGITLGVGGGQKLITPLTSRLQYPVLDKVLKSSGVNDADRAVIIDKFKKAYVPWEENSFPGMLGNVIAGRVANRFDLGGMNCVVDAACAGSLAAIKLAVSDLLERRSDYMITGGVCADNSPFMYMSFSKTPAFTTNDTIRPFDHDSKGMMVGEGIGLVALKRLEDAQRDGDRIYSVIRGIGTSSDGRFKSIYAPRPEGQMKALRRAYEDAGIAPNTMGLIEAHGTGTAAGDAAEFAALNAFFTESDTPKNQIALGTVKSQVGHTKSAAGAAGMIKAALALHHKVLPATINVTKPNPLLGVEDSPFHINTETRPWMPRADGLPRRAGVSSFGFGGTNFHFVLEEDAATPKNNFRHSTNGKAIVLSAENAAALTAAAQQWAGKLANADQAGAAFSELAAQNGLRAIAKNQARVGFVAKNAADAAATLDTVIKQLQAQASAEQWSLPSGVTFRREGIDTEGKLAALFSGQGSQYVNMAREVTYNFPPMMQTISAMDQLFATDGKNTLSSLIFPNPVFDKADAEVQEKQLQLTQHAQPSIGVIGVGFYKLLQQAGFKANFAAGHSFGELTALWAGGVLADDDYLMLAKARGQAMSAPDDANFDAGTMIAVVGDVDKVAADIAGFENVSIANYNSKDQVVVAGATEQVNKAFDALKQKGYKVVKLPVSAAFHTPLVGHAQKPFADAIEKARFNKPTIPVFANGTGKPHSDKPADIKKVMKNHILESVRFKDEVENMYAAGGRVFVEFGPKNVLTKLVENILGDKSDVVTVALNANPKKDSDTQLRNAAVQLAVIGVQLADIDPYAFVKPVKEGKKKSPMTIKLNAGAYISDKTRKVFADALLDGHRIQGESKVEVVEKIVEKVVEKVVERIVEVPVAGAALHAMANPVAAGAVIAGTTIDSSSVLDSIEKTLSQFVGYQRETAAVHEKYLESPKVYSETFLNLMQQQIALAAQGITQIPDSIDRSMTMFHQLQAETLRAHEQYLTTQASSVNTALGMVQNQYAGLVSGAPVQNLAPVVRTHSVVPVQSSPIGSKPVVSPAATPVASPQAPVAAAAYVAPAPVAAVKTAPAPQSVAPQPVAPQPVAVPAAAGIDVVAIQKVMLDVVAEKTGYPAEMLELSMDMEADLGIDSIKRVEILGSVQEQLPGLPELNPEDLAELRTLGQIVDYMKSKAPAASAVVAVPAGAKDISPLQGVASGGFDVAAIQKVMMTVVAEKTGYPAEMLELSMDMEADLGIDSIKRVEILGAVQEELPGLPELNPEDLAELRTLGQIVDYMQSKAPAGAPVASVVAAPVGAQFIAPTAAPAAAAGVDVAAIQKVMMTVVSEKTGYPAEMLELSMDMEADLGIDSIKRVEILGAVQEELPGLPELNPEDLAELRTLGQIVDYMKSKAGSVVVATSAVAKDVSPLQSAAVGGTINVSELQPLVLAIVAEKTGYPVEMLELDMDMEADLGIDSIKRVEILSAVQERVPGMPELNPDVLAEFRTLQQIVDAMGHTSNFGGATAAFDAAPSATVVVKKLPQPDLLAVKLPKASLCLVNDDGSAAVTPLIAQLQKQGWEVAVLQWPLSLASRTAKLPAGVKAVNVVDSGEAALQAAIETVTQTIGNIAALIHLQPARSIKGIEFPDAARDLLRLVFLQAKHLKVALNEAAASGGRAAFITVTRIDGQLGWKGGNGDLLQAGLFGLTKTLHHEWPTVFCRAIDTDPAFDGEALAKAIVTELWDVDTRTPEIGISASERITLVAEKTDSYAQSAGKSITKDSVFLVSGGAKGVTTACVAALAKKSGGKYILLGRSELLASEPAWSAGVTADAELKKRAMAEMTAKGDKPTPVKVQQFLRPILSSREITQALDAIRKAGGEAEYVAGDVTDAAGIKTKLASVTKKFGKITGIVHGAGVLADRLIEQKTVKDFDAVYGTKIDGLAALLACVDQKALTHLVLFSSAAGFYGNVGQSDYAIANDILNKTAVRFKQLNPAAQCLAFDWGPWDGGMVTPELKRMFTERGVYIIPLEAGAQLFASEVGAAANRCPQIVVGNEMSGVATEGTPAKKLLASRLSRAISRTANPFVDHHVIGGNPVMPTVAMIGWMAAGCEALFPGFNYAGLRNYRLFKGIVFDGSEPAVIQLDANPEQPVNGELIVKVQIFSDNNGKRVNHYGADVVLNANLPAAPQYANAFAKAGGAPTASYSDGTLFHGALLQGITDELEFSDKRLVLGCMITAPATAQQGQFVVGATNLFADDLLFQAMLVWARKQYGAGSLPSSVAAFEQYRVVQAGERCFIAVDVIRHTEKALVADVTMMAADGAVISRFKSAEVTISATLNTLFKPAANG